MTSGWREIEWRALGLWALLLPVSLLTLVIASDAEPQARKGATAKRTAMVTKGLVHGDLRDSLSAFLLAYRARYRIGEPIPLLYGVAYLPPPPSPENNWKFEAATIWRPIHPTSDGTFCWLVVTGPDGARVRYQGATICLPVWGLENSVRVCPSAFHGGLCADLRNSYDLNKPGIYTVRWVHAPRFAAAGPWNGRLESNDVKIEIVP